MTTIQRGRPVISLEPRGFLAGFDINELRRKIATAPYDKAWARLVQRGKEQIALVRASKFTKYTGAIGWHNPATAVLEAALMALLVDDRDALEYVHESIAFLAEKAKARKDNPKAKFDNIHAHIQVAIAADMLRTKLSDEALTTHLAFMRDHAIDYHLGPEGFARYNAGNNINWCQNVHAAGCALLWGEDCGHPDWRSVVEIGIKHTRGYLKYGCDEAGFSFEGTGYGHGVFFNLFNFVQLLKQSGYADLYVQEPRLKRIFDSTLQSMFPDRSFFTNDNDVGLHGAASVYYLLFAYRQWRDPFYMGFWNEYQGPDHPMRPYGDFFPWLNRVCDQNEPALDMLSSIFFAILYWDASAPATPLEQLNRPTTTYSPGTERADFRTSWSRDAVYVNILGAGRSHMSQTHRHADTGHFSFFAHGDYLAIDTGRYNSNEDQHNVVLVDGKNHLHVNNWGMDGNKGRLENFQSRGDLTYIMADAAHMKGCFWADRHFFFVKYGPDQAYLAILDNLNPDNAKHNFLWQLQANHDCKIDIQSDTKAALVGPRARLDMTFAVPGPLDFPGSPHVMTLRQDIQEWQWPYGKPQEISGILKVGVLQSSVYRPRLLADVTGLNGVILSLLSPRRHGEAPLPVRHVPRKFLLEMEIEAGEYRDTILAAPDRGYIETETVSAMTELAWIRRDQTGRVLQIWSVDGSPVTVKK